MATYLGHQEDSSGNILLPTPHSMAAQVELGTTASQAYSKGTYLVFNNRLCKASTAIVSGDTLAIGTNLVQCSIGSELSSHLQANNNEFYFDYHDGKFGFNTSPLRGVETFVPFSQQHTITVSGSAGTYWKWVGPGSDNYAQYDGINLSIVLDGVTIASWSQKEGGVSYTFTTE